MRKSNRIIIHKNQAIFILILIVFSTFSYCTAQQNSWIRINQLGYLPHSIKVAVFASKEKNVILQFTVHDAKTNAKIYTSKKAEAKGAFGPFIEAYRLDFSDLIKNGKYYIKVNNVKSPVFDIHPNVYDHTADFLLEYMRQQRCGYNPYLTDSCHLNDGYILYHPTKTGQHIDVTGGWHDATDYLQYTATSANAVFQLLFAYRENPSSFGDYYQSNGLPGSNGVPDIIEEAKFGMDWLKKMNPAPDEYYNQIADDRDHIGFRLPNKDTAKYDKPYEGRPVYLASAEKQGLKKYQNRSTGAASTAGKFASAFAIGTSVLAEFYPEYTVDMPQRAIAAYAYGQNNPGVSQTAPCKGPYFYEEENWVDDMELAAASLYQLTKDAKYKMDALEFASLEKTSPWMGKDTARHYQYYPFINVGHYEISTSIPPEEKKLVSTYYDQGLNMILDRGQQNPFIAGIPFVWCSNNFVVAALTQSNLYSKMTQDKKYAEMEASLRDWLFGCNPWGTSMIVGLPSHGDSPVDPHSSLNILEKYQTHGGLIDGPVYGSIYNRLIGLQLFNSDEYASFQSDYFVYHDDAGDYSTNEPTMDGTASLVYYLSSLEKEGQSEGHIKNQLQIDKDGAIRRGDISKKELTLVFTGDEFSDGFSSILRTLKKHKVKGAFFLTGRFYKDVKNQDFIKDAIKQGHYLGAHSDQHLLYNDWTDQKNLLVSQDQFKNDLIVNYGEMAKFGIGMQESKYFLPPYEWHNEIITQWADQMGLKLINYTQGTLSHADYTTPDMKNYRSSITIFDSIIQREKSESLNGYILLSHVGTHPDRIDKFYNQLDKLIRILKSKKYSFRHLSDHLECGYQP